MKKGFQQVNSRDFFYIYYHNGQKTGIHTKVSMGSNHDIGDSLISKMARQVQLSKDEFGNLVDCRLSGEELRMTYERRGILPTFRLQ
jgi:hypothetical protein